MQNLHLVTLDHRFDGADEEAFILATFVPLKLEMQRDRPPEPQFTGFQCVPE